MKNTTSQKLSLEKIKITRLNEMKMILGGDRKGGWIDKYSDTCPGQTTATPDSTDPAGTMGYA